jgi:hypothetical protein
MVGCFDYGERATTITFTQGEIQDLAESYEEQARVGAGTPGFLALFDPVALVLYALLKRDQ